MENVTFGKLTQETEIAVSDTGLSVVVRNLSWPDFMASLDIEDLVERGIFRLLKVVVRWNIVDDATNEPLAISAENIRKLPASIIFPLNEALKGHFGLAQKKKI